MVRRHAGHTGIYGAPTRGAHGQQRGRQWLCTFCVFCSLLAAPRRGRRPSREGAADPPRRHAWAGAAGVGDRCRLMGLPLLQVIPPQPLQRILSALSQRLAATEGEEEVSESLSALLHLLQSEDVRDTVLSNSGDASLVELCRDLIAGLSKAVRLASISIGLTAVAIFDTVCQNEKARQLLLQHSDTEPIFERIPQLLADMARHSLIPLSVAHLTRYPSAQRRVLASGRCGALLAGLNELLLCQDPRIASDAGCAVGNIAFNDEGRYQVLAYKSLDDVVAGLIHVLKSSEEFAGNAAWAIGNLCRHEGWCSKMLEKADFVEDVVKGITNLVATTDLQTACDWACAVAMMTATPNGQKAVLAHEDSEMLIVRLLHNAASADTLVMNSACLALRNLKKTSQGRERYSKTVTLISAGRPSEIIDGVIESGDYDTGANAAIIMRGLPASASAPMGASAGNGKVVSGLGSECWAEDERAAPVRQDRVCIKSLDGAVLRSLSINLLTAQGVVEDSRPCSAGTKRSDTVSCGMQDGLGESEKAMSSSLLLGITRAHALGTRSARDAVANGNSGGAGAIKQGHDTHVNQKKRDSSHLDEPGADLSVYVEAVGDAAGDGGELGPAPAGHTVKAVELVECDETRLSVCWEPVCVYE